MRDLNPDNWRVMMAMEQHTLERQKESFYEVNQTNTVKFLQDHVFNNKEEAEHGDAEDDNTNTSISSFTDDEINAVVNVLDVNDNMPECTPTLAKVEENADPGTLIGKCAEQS